MGEFESDDGDRTNLGADRAQRTPVDYRRYRRYFPIGSQMRSFVAQYDCMRNNTSNAVNDTTHAAY